MPPVEGFLTEPQDAGSGHVTSGQPALPAGLWGWGRLARRWLKQQRDRRAPYKREGRILSHAEALEG